jgi:hypothetical protein
MTEEFVEDIITTATVKSQPTETIASKSQPEPKDQSTTDVTSTTDDATQPDKGAVQDQTPPEDNPAIIELATQLGWKPNHEGENFVDAKTYILRSREIQDSMRDHNKDLKQQLQTIQGSVEALKEHNERVYKAEVSRLQGEVDRLRKERKAAIEMADVDKVDELDKEIGTIEKSLSEPKPKSAPATNPIYDEWVQDNQWYLTNNEMAAYADMVAQQYAGAPLERLYPLVRQKVAEVFPEAFEKKPAVNPANPGTLANPGEKAPAAPTKPVGPASPVESGHKQAGTKSFTKADLSAEQLSIMNQFVKSGIMTEDQYISDLAKLQEA